MKKITGSTRVTWAVPVVTLFRDDIDEILDILREDGPVVVTHGGYEFEGIDELRSKRGDDLTGIGLSGKHVSLSLWRRSGELQGDNADAAHTFFPVRDLLERRRRWMSRIPTTPVWTTLAMGASMMLLVAYNLLGGVRASSWWASLLLILWPFFIAPAPSLLFEAAIRRNRVVLRARHEAPGFWARKKDDIALLVLGALAGAALTWLLKA